MNRLSTTVSLSSVALCIALSSTTALAQTDSSGTGTSTDSDATAAPATPATGASDADAAKTPAPGADKQALVDEAQMGDSAAELPGKTYYFVGARYRGIIVPKFFQNLFADGGSTVYVNGFGPEFAIRKNGFEYNLSPWIALYNMGDTPFKGKNDPDTAYEVVSTKIQMLYLTSDFLWSHEFTPEFALNYGVGAGLGILFGNVFRTQSYPPNGVSGDPSTYVKCPGPSDDPKYGGYCGNDNNHYNGYKEPSWANSGSKPVVFPWLTLQTGVRIKPSKSMVFRVDLGFGTSGFLLGLGADYGL